MACSSGQDCEAGTLRHLNVEQKQATTASLAPLMVIAGPGSGKTRTLIERVCHLLTTGILPEKILCLTFTRRAAKELSERLELQFPGQKTCPKACTLHALAFEWHCLQNAPAMLLDENTARKIFASLHPEQDKRANSQAFADINTSREQRNQLPTHLERLFQPYAAYKKQHNLVDYTDLLETFLEHLLTNETTPWQAVLVDEIQDLSRLQLEVIKALLPLSGQGFFCIGDPDQAIYGFRGAYGQVQEFFSAVWPELRILKLTSNYRSAPRLVKLAGEFMAHYSVGGKLTPALEGKGQVTLFSALSAESEALWVAEKIHLLLGSGSHTLTDQPGNDESWLPLGSGQLSPADIAVLVRSHALIPPLKKAMESQGIIPSIPEKTAFWQDACVVMILDAVKEMLGMLENSLPPVWDHQALRLGPKALQIATLKTYDQPSLLQISPRQKPDEVFWHSKTFQDLLRQYNALGSWEALLNWVHLQSDLEGIKKRAEQVQIMTLHASKGLEFQAVFMPCLEEGLLPFYPVATPQEELPEQPIQEERRLFYVGLTRAKQSLFLSHANKRLRFGQEYTQTGSRFLRSLPASLVDHRALVAYEKKASRQLSLF